LIALINLRVTLTKVPRATFKLQVHHPTRVPLPFEPRRSRSKAIWCGTETVFVKGWVEKHTFQKPEKASLVVWVACLKSWDHIPKSLAKSNSSWNTGGDCGFKHLLEVFFWRSLPRSASLVRRMILGLSQKRILPMVGLQGRENNRWIILGGIKYSQIHHYLIDWFEKIHPF
jgi:hypothetical protein